jgi:VIT1/CCC1 family predicted Fe2+/Mn2+ transporter
MPEPSIDTPQALDAEIAARLQVRRERLERRIRSQGLGAAVVFGMSGLSALCALAAFFAAHDIEAAVVIAMMTVMIFALAFLTWKVGRARLLDELREMDQGTGSGSHDP